MDERLRELERRWRASGAHTDWLAYLHERRRAAGSETARRRSDIAAFDPAVLREPLAAFFRRRLPLLRRDPPYINAWQGALIGDLERFVVGTKLVPWLVPELAPHRFDDWGSPPFLEVGRPDRIDPAAAVDNVLGAFARVRRVHLELLELLDLPLPIEDAPGFAEGVRVALRRITDFVIMKTRCEDAWYVMVADLFGLFLRAKQVELPEALLEELAATTLRVHFESWIEPSTERVRVAADETALALVRALFDERYGER